MGRQLERSDRKYSLCLSVFPLCQSRSFLDTGLCLYPFQGAGMRGSTQRALRVFGHLRVFLYRHDPVHRDNLSNHHVYAGRLRTEMDLSQVLHIRVVAVRDTWGLMTMIQ